MAVNRLTQMFSEPTNEAAAQAQGIPAGFTLCPIFIIQFQGQQQLNSLQDLYRQAYEQAQAKARLSRLEKRFFSIWN